MLSHLVYLSAKPSDLTVEDEVAIMATAVTSNAEHGVTGCLISTDSDFLQILEGDATALRTVMDNISRDPRHSLTEVSEARPCVDRTFADWKMGFAALPSGHLIFESVRRQGVAHVDIATLSAQILGKLSLFETLAKVRVQSARSRELADIVRQSQD